MADSERTPRPGKSQRATPRGPTEAPLGSTSDRVKLAIIGALTVAIAVAVVLFVVLSEEDEGNRTDIAEVSTDLSEKPTPAVPEGEPPAELVIDDIVEGEGPEAKEGDSISVDYVGALASNGLEFDASWDAGQTFDLDLPGQVIPGWNEGIPGMKVGGRRQLTIPADLAYGQAGQPPVIPPNSALVFVIDLREISDGPSGGSGAPDAPGGQGQGG